MPIVPGNDMFVQSVLPERGQTGGKPLDEDYARLNVSPAMFGGQVGQTLQQTGDMLAQSALRFQQINNETVATKADVELTKRLADLQYNVDPSKPLGFNNLRGADAVNAQQNFKEQVQQIYQDVRSTLNGPAQRMFDYVATRRTGYTLESGEQHASKEWLQDILDTSKERISVQRNLAAMDPYNPSVLNHTIGLIQSESQKISDALGKHDPVYMQSQMQQEKDQLYHDVALRQATDTTNPGGGPIAALNFYSQHKDEMSLRMQTGLKAKLRPLAQVWDSRNFVNGLIGGSNVSPGDVQINPSARIATAHNNPGNLMWANQPGAVQGEPKAGGGYWAKFETPEAGWQAELNQIEIDKRNHPDFTLSQLINKYGPGSDNNDPQWYANTVAKNLGIKPDTLITQIPTEALGRQIVAIESNTTVKPKITPNMQVADASGQIVPQQQGDFIKPAAPEPGQRTVEDLEASLPDGAGDRCQIFRQSRCASSGVGNIALDGQRPNRHVATNGAGGY